MTENLTDIICSLSGDALMIGGSCFVGYATLKTVSGVSGTLTKTLEYAPKIINDPSIVVEDFNSINDTDDEDSYPILQKIVSYGATVGTVVGIGLLGVLMKRVGTKIKTEQFKEFVLGFAKY